MLPIFFSLGPINLYSYGLFMAIALIAATFIIWKLAREEELEEEKIFDLILITTGAGLVGSRLLYVFLHLNDFTPNLIRTIHLTKFPGLSFQGGLVLGLIVSIIFIYRKKLSVWQIGDIAVLGLVLGQAIGRIGCFLNGCCYGVVTTLPWGVYFPGLIGKRHPTQIYESLADFLIFFLLLKIYKKTYLSKKDKRGAVLISYFIFTSLMRFLIESLRADSVYLHGIKIAQLISGTIFIISSILFIIKYRKEIGTFFGQLVTIIKSTKIKPRGR